MQIDLDGFCLIIQRELAEITAVRSILARLPSTFHLTIVHSKLEQHPSPAPETFVFNELNQPFAPSDRRSAKEIMSETDHDYHHREKGMASVRRALLNNWRDITDHTSHHAHP